MADILNGMCEDVFNGLTGSNATLSVQKCYNQVSISLQGSEMSSGGWSHQRFDVLEDSSYL